MDDTLAMTALTELGKGGQVMIQCDGEAEAKEYYRIFSGAGKTCKLFPITKLAEADTWLNAVRGKPLAAVIYPDPLR